MDQIGKSESKDKLSLMGNLVSFYAASWSPEKSVISRHAAQKQAWHWKSDGRTGFEIREATDDESKMLIGDRAPPSSCINDDSVNS
jgi:HSP90 family molecular chaperone